MKRLESKDVSGRKPRKSSARLWVLLARDAAVAAIFRRGPSRQVQLIKWNLEDDTFEDGQWFKGRIYERRCDLSPSGTLLIYFAATHKEPLFSWTAISKLPWFTALALWPKGDCWNGGGHFIGPYRIHLDHFPSENIPHPDFASGCRKFQIQTFATARGEDTPVWHHTLKRDGWSQVHAGDWGKHGQENGYSWKSRIPEQWSKPHQKRRIRLAMFIHGMGQDNGPWHVTSYRVADNSGAEVSSLGPADWADWDKQGDLLFALGGRLYRQRFQKTNSPPPTLLADLNHHEFAAIPPTDWAKKL